MKISLQRIGVLSFGKFTGAVSVIFGILGFLVFLVLFLIAPTQSATTALITAVVGVVAYIIGGFIAGCLVAFFYNIALGFVGGVEFEFKEEADDKLVRKYKNML